MANILDEKNTVRDVAAKVPSARKVFEKYGIDYCCGGLKTLDEAAAEARVNVDDLRGALTESLNAPCTGNEEERDWYGAPLAELVDHIEERHHTFMKEQLPQLKMLLERVRKAHGAAHGEMLAELDETYQALREEIESHLMKEEQILFPYIRKMEAWAEEGFGKPQFHCGTVESPILQMEHEHDNAGGALARMRTITGNYALPGDACATFAALYEGLQAMEADLHEHIHLENNILFPRTIEFEREA